MRGARERGLGRGGVADLGIDADVRCGFVLEPRRVRRAAAATASVTAGSGS